MDDPTAILRRVNETYSQCRSYSDSGFAVLDDVQQNKERIEFRTLFVRPDYFCFEWQDYGPRRGKSERFSTVWSNGEKTIVRHDTGQIKIENMSSLNLAIAGATGCSAAAAYIVPALLLPQLRGPKHLFMLSDLELISQDTVGEDVCYILRGSLLKKADHILWISKNDFSLRRLTSDYSRTAEELERAMQEITKNVELMAKLAENGIVPPSEVKHEALRLVTEYFYSEVSFDEPIVPAPEPVAL